MKKAKYLLLTIVSIYIFIVQPVFAIGILIGYVFGYFSAIEGMKQTDKIRKFWEAKGWMVINLIKTNKNGIPDYMMLKDGGTIFVESKESWDKLSKIQEYRISQLKDAGFDVYVNDIKQ